MRVIGDLSRLNGIRYPDKAALIMNDQILSYKELDRQSNGLANALIGLGLQAGDRVALLSYNRLEYPIITQAVAKTGALLVPMNFRLVSNEIAHILSNAEPGFLIMEASFLVAVEEAIQKLPSAPQIILIDEHQTGLLHVEQLISESDHSPPGIEVDPESSCVIMYTSGTTGTPKGVLVSHATYFRMYAAHSIEAGLAHEDIYLIAVPMFHAAGLNMALHQTLFMGATGIIHRERFEPEVIFGLIQKHRISLAILVPMTVSLLAFHPKLSSFDTSSLTRIFYGSAPITPNILQQAFRVFSNVSFVQFYGSTEAGMIGALRPADHAKFSHTTGHQALLTESRIITETGEDAKPGEIGEIIVLQKSMGMIDYWRNPEASKETIRDGWIYTGDLARVEEQGFFTVVDRKTEVIISGGENVYPREVEIVIASHPAVREVAVFGRPDELYGETICAALGLWPDKTVTSSELIDFCKTRLASYKCPKYIDFHEHLPRNASDKIMKKALKQPYL
jgi:acyl-CoA synthetase (AMP-forming)/AMP-acid ligase II